MQRMRMFVALAALIALAGAAGSARGATRMATCSFKKGGVVVAFAGRGVATPWGHAFCNGFHSTFGGRRFYGYFGRDRCDFYNYRHRVLMAVLSENKVAGWLTCQQITPSAVRAGFRPEKKATL